MPFSSPCCLHRPTCPSTLSPSPIAQYPMHLGKETMSASLTLAFAPPLVAPLPLSLPLSSLPLSSLPLSSLPLSSLPLRSASRNAFFSHPLSPTQSRRHSRRRRRHRQCGRLASVCSATPPAPPANSNPSPNPFSSSITSPVTAGRPTLLPPPYSCGFAALLGPSNSGKSTLLNALVGQKVAIVTPKVQTTRCRVCGIAAYGRTQVVYMDTPGIFSASSRLSRAMVKSAWTSGAQADAVGVVLDAAAMFHEARRKGVRKLLVPDEAVEVLKGCAERRRRGATTEVCVCANKMDAVPEGERRFVEERVRGLMEVCGLQGGELVMMAAREGEGVTEFVEWVKGRMPEGEWVYGEDEFTDMPARLLAAEVCREQVFMVLKQELPYEMAVETTSYREKEDMSIRITQDVLVGRTSQRKIVLGRGGAVIKMIGMRARKELEGVLGTTVHLVLTVKVKGKWKEDKRQYDQWGLDFNA